MDSIRRAFAANIWPALGLWAASLLIFWAWRVNPATQAALGELAAFKARLGLEFSMPAQAFAAGLLPFGLSRLQRSGRTQARTRDLPFLLAFWALQGGVTDTFYALQAHVWGAGADWRTVALKSACDLGAFTPLLVMPLIVWAFAFKDCGYSPDQTRQFLGRGWVRERLAPMYASALLVWTPAVLVLYALPLALQFPFQAAVQCFWGLVIFVLTGEKSPPKP